MVAEHRPNSEGLKKRDLTVVDQKVGMSRNRFDAPTVKRAFGVARPNEG
jgi:hypothetical protein